MARFYKRKYGVELDPETEVLALIGSKEGIAHLVTAVINHGDRVLIPDPGYPVYRTAVQLAGGVSCYFELDQKRGYIPNFAKISTTTLKRAKLMFLNYPANPTAASIGLDTFAKAVAFAKQHRIALAHDAAYSLVTFGNYEAPSIMQVLVLNLWRLSLARYRRAFIWLAGVSVTLSAIRRCLALYRL